MKKRSIYVMLCCLGFVVLAYSCNQAGVVKNEVVASKEPDSMKLIQRGKYLVSEIGTCGDCHSPRIIKNGIAVFDSTRLYSGFPSDRPIPEINTDETSKGYIVAFQDFTSVSGPWGTSFAANITSDPSGIGTWSFEQFETALRHGKYKGFMDGRPMLPPMPWENFRSLPDEDLKAMFYFLKSTQPVRNIVPAPIFPKKADS